MAGRNNKVGLDYFELDCHMDEKVRLIQAEFGLSGFAVFVKLLQEIYGGQGYYCEWNQDRELLFASENGLINGNVQLLRDIVAACIRRNIFSQSMYEKYGVLTSTGVQKQYLKATSKRDFAYFKKELLLIEIPSKRTNVVINSISDGINAISGVRNEQSREEKSREEKSNNKLCKADALALFEELWKLYPNKKGKGQVSDAAKKRLLNVGKEEMVRAIERYKKHLQKNADWLRPQNGSTFFNSGYVDYLDANYEESKTTTYPSKGNTFTQFEQRDYDFSAIEERLLRK